MERVVFTPEPAQEVAERQVIMSRTKAAALFVGAAVLAAGIAYVTPASAETNNNASISFTNDDVTSPVLTGRRFAAIRATTQDNGCRIVAHRGDVHGNADENTMRSIKRAIGIGRVDAIEYDIRQISDGTDVLMHDPTFNRTTNKSGAIAAASEQKVDSARTRKHHLRVPRFTNIAHAIGQSSKGTQTEAKTVWGKKRAQHVLDVLEANGLTDKTMITSSHMSNHKLLNELTPNIPTGLIIGDKYGFPSKNVIDQAKKNGADAINIGYKAVTPAHVKSLHKQGFAVGTRSVNTKAQLYKVLNVKKGRIGPNAVDTVVTDNTKAIANLCAKLKPAIKVTSTISPSPTTKPSATTSPSPSVSLSTTVSSSPSESPTSLPPETPSEPVAPTESVTPTE